METIVTKVLGKYFKQFIKGFQRDQFTVTLLKGRAQLTDLELNEQFLQQMLMVPPNLEIQSCRCNELTVTIPNVTKFSDKPITLTLDKVYLSLEEPEVLRPLTNPPKKEQPPKKPPRASSSSTETPKTKKKKNKSLNKMIQDMRIIINEVHFVIKLLPHQLIGLDAPWRPMLEVKLSNILIQSSNENWEVVNLTKSRGKDTETNIETAYKMAQCKSISVSLQGTGEEETFPILSNIPIDIHVTTSTDMTTRELLSANLNFILDEIRFSWNRMSWGMVVQLLSSLRQCLERDPNLELNSAAESPQLTPSKDQPASPEPKNLPPVNRDISYTILVKKWFMSFLQQQDNASDGYEFAGSNLRFSVTPKKLILVDEVKTFESKVVLSADSFTFGEITPGASYDPSFPSVISQISQGPLSDEKSESPDHPFFVLNVNHRWTENSLRSTQFEVQLYDLRLVLHREVLKSFYKYLSASIIDVCKQDFARAREKKVTEDKEKKEEKIEQFVSKLKAADMSAYFYWLYKSQISIDIHNTQIIIPRDSEPRADGVQISRQLRATAKKLSLSNCSGWDIVPYLSEALTNFESDFLATVSDPSKVANKIQWDIADVMIDTTDITGTVYSPLLLPTTMKIYSRFLEKSPEQLQQKMELAIHSNSFQLILNKEQQLLFSSISPLFGRWAHKLSKEFKGVSSEVKEGLKETLEEGKQTVLLVATKLAENTVAEKLIKPSSDTAQAVEDVIKLFQFAFVFKAESGMIRIPLHHFEKVSEEIVLQSQSELLSELTFEALDFVMENSLNHQVFQLQLGKFLAKDLDHEKAPMSFSILPVSVASDHLDGQFRHLVISGSRDRPKDGKPSTDLLLRLQGMQTRAQLKAGAMKDMQGYFETVLPQIQKSFKKMVDRVLSLKQNEKIKSKIGEKVGAMKEKLQDGIGFAEKTLDYLALRWALQIADCEFVVFDADGNDIEDSSKPPLGSIKIANFNRDLVADRLDALMMKLVMTKLKLAEANDSLNDAVVQKKDLQEEIAKLEKQSESESEKAKNELLSIEQQLIETKMALVEAQVALEDMRRSTRAK